MKGRDTDEHVEGKPVSYTTYCNYGCRCPGCKEDSRLYKAAWWKSPKGQAALAKQRKNVSPSEVTRRAWITRRKKYGPLGRYPSKAFNVSRPRDAIYTPEQIKERSQMSASAYHSAEKQLWNNHWQEYDSIRKTLKLAGYKKNIRDKAKVLLRHNHREEFKTLYEAAKRYEGL